MKTLTIDVFTFEELSDAAKETARAWYRESMSCDEWWDSVYEDAKQAGLKITGFDIDRASYVKAEFIHDACFTAHYIVDNHGDTCETFKTAQSFLSDRDKIVNEAPRDENGDWEDENELDAALDDCEAEFLKSICEDYRIILTREYEYRYSNECVDESILSNEYTFTKNGKREG